MDPTRVNRLANARPKGTRPQFMSGEVERVLNITMALAQEVSVLRERNDTLERLLLAKGVLQPGEIDNFQPDATAAAERGQAIQDFLARVLRVIEQEIAAVQQPQDAADVNELSQS
jgi:hypothetical protein